MTTVEYLSSYGIGNGIGRTTTDTNSIVTADESYGSDLLLFLRTSADKNMNGMEKLTQGRSSSTTNRKLRMSFEFLCNREEEEEKNQDKKKQNPGSQFLRIPSGFITIKPEELPGSYKSGNDHLSTPPENFEHSSNEKENNRSPKSCLKSLNSKRNMEINQDLKKPQKSSNFGKCDKQHYRRGWTRMTPELFECILNWESEQRKKGVIKQSDIEKQWNVNRTTYYRWKLRRAENWIDF